MIGRDKVKEFYEMCGYLALCFIVFCIGLYMGNNFVPKDRRIISYEYTIKCRCGKTIEGYQSLVDGFNQEECKSCGYHAEFKK